MKILYCLDQLSTHIRAQETLSITMNFDRTKWLDEIWLHDGAKHYQVTLQETATMVNQNHHRFRLYEVDSKAQADPKRQATRC